MGIAPEAPRNGNGFNCHSGAAEGAPRDTTEGIEDLGLGPIAPERRGKFQSGVKTVRMSRPAETPLTTHNSVSKRDAQRLRGEAFNQELRRTFSFAGGEIAANLLALHEERSILLRFDVSAEHNDTAELVPLSKMRVAYATAVINAVRKEFEGVRATMERMLGRRGREIEFEGPYTPAAEPVLSLMIHVARNTNYDSIYNRVLETLAYHELNDDRDRLIRNQVRTNFPFPGDVEPYHWTNEELDYIERMPPPELHNLVDRNGEPVPIDVFMKAPPVSDRSEGSGFQNWLDSSDASTAAGEALRCWIRRL